MDPFLLLQSKVSSNFIALSKQSVLYYKAVDRDLIWEKYLDGFANSIERDSHNCNSCKSFLRQWSGIVAIINSKVVSLWENIEVPEYDNCINNIKSYLDSLPITDVFVNEFSKCGTLKNLDRVNLLTWSHFYIEVPSKFVRTSGIDTFRAEKRDNKNLLLRALTELKLEATETVLELIAQSSLYRGSEFKNNLESFQKVQKDFVTAIDPEIYCWENSNTLSTAVSRIRNTAIGTLLIDLSEDLPVDVAVSKYERVVAPNNYKRPTALVTSSMINDAKKKLEELGLIKGLERRHATDRDLSINNILFTDKTVPSTDIFNILSSETLVSPKSFSKTEEVSIDDFLSRILPVSTSIEVLIENSHLNNFVTLVTSEEVEAPNLFKWNNNFSWNYTGGITDSIKENVKKAGGNVNAVLRASLQWNESGNNVIDFDLHAIEPDNSHICFSKFRGASSTKMTGNLDLDIIVPVGIAVENIVWTNLSKMTNGEYRVFVKNYSSRTSAEGFNAEVEFAGETYSFSYPSRLKGHQEVEICVISLHKSIFTIKSSLSSNSSISSTEKWNTKTNQFKKVNKILLSPNYWEESEEKTNVGIGNKHYLFILDKCTSDEKIRPFFNEFLKPELDPYKKVFEVLGSKLTIPESKDQLSGIGFSSTLKNYVILKVDGKIKKTIKVIF